MTDNSGLTDEQLFYDDIIKKYVYSNCYKLKSTLYDTDDLIQECWCHVLNAMDNHPNETLTRGFIYCICRNTLVDIYREQMRAPKSFSIDALFEIPSENDENETFLKKSAEYREQESLSDFYIPPSDELEKVEESERVQKLLEYYPEGSNEYYYILFYMSKANLVVTDVFNPDNDKYKNGYTDGYLASFLGFKSGTSNIAWIEFRNRMKKVISRYLGSENKSLEEVVEEIKNEELKETESEEKNYKNIIEIKDKEKKENE